LRTTDLRRNARSAQHSPPLLPFSHHHPPQNTNCLSTDVCLLFVCCWCWGCCCFFFCRGSSHRRRARVVVLAAAAAAAARPLGGDALQWCTATASGAPPSSGSAATPARSNLQANTAAHTNCSLLSALCATSALVIRTPVAVGPGQRLGLVAVVVTAAAATTAAAGRGSRARAGPTCSSTRARWKT
jgi:hypothetical protein